jgi:hypothetical protein
VESERSPLSPYALNVEDVQRLQPGTRLVVFNKRTGSRGARAFTHIHDGRIYWHVPDETAKKTKGHIDDSNYLADCGLQPHSNGSWNDMNFTIRAEDLGNIPEPPPQSSCVLPFDMQ